MTSVPNARPRLALRTSAPKCVAVTPNSLPAMLRGFSESLDSRSPSLPMIANHPQHPKCSPQKLPAILQMLFNIHSPNQDHRDRG